MGPIIAQPLPHVIGPDWFQSFFTEWMPFPPFPLFRGAATITFCQLGPGRTLQHCTAELEWRDNYPRARARAKQITVSIYVLSEGRAITNWLYLSLTLVFYYSDEKKKKKRGAMHICQFRINGGKWVAVRVCRLCSRPFRAIVSKRFEIASQALFYFNLTRILSIRYSVLFEGNTNAIDDCYLLEYFSAFENAIMNNEHEFLWIADWVWSGCIILF